MHFAELTAGRTIRCGPATLTEREIVEFAHAYDPQWFHTDPARAATGAWKGLIASGWQTCAVAMRLAVEHILADSELFGSPGLAYVKWTSPVRPGDELWLTVEILEQRVARSNPSLGILRWRWLLANLRGDTVVDLEATSLFDLATKPGDGS